MALSLNTGVELTTGEVLKLSEIDLGEENFVYSCEPSGRIRVSKIVDIKKTVKKVCKITLSNGKEIICDRDQIFQVHGKDSSVFVDIKPENFLIGCSFNPNNNMVFDHCARLFVPSEKIAYETYDLFEEVYGERDLMSILDLTDENKMGMAKHHMELIQSVTRQNEQLILRLSNDNHLLNILGLEYLSYAEVERLIEHFEIAMNNKIYSDNELELVEILMNNTPLESYTPIEDLIEFLKAGGFSNINDGGDITKDDLDKLALDLGYSYISHLTSVKCYHGPHIDVIESLDIEEECCTIELDGSDSIGLSCGIFVNTSK